MTSHYEIVPASIRHVRPMSRHLRAATCLMLQPFSLEPRLALHRAFMASSYARTAAEDGRPIAMWGVAGALLDPWAFVWLVMSEAAARMPFAVVREARAELSAIMRDKTEVTATVLPDDLAAIRFAVFLGFHDRDNDDGHLSKKALCEAIVNDPKYRIAIGDQYVIALGYHPELRH